MRPAPNMPEGEHGLEQHRPERDISRRDLLKISAAAGGGMLLSFGLPVVQRRAEAAAAVKILPPDAFIRIDPNNVVTFIVPRVEMGQGTYTSLSMLIAEELEVELSQIHVEHAPPDPKLYSDPILGEQATGGSTSIRGAFDPLRRVGATARTMLIAAAARRWRVGARCRLR
jgi:isoquinoline 1-oxidoreductase beta subunit